MNLFIISLNVCHYTIILQYIRHVFSMNFGSCLFVELKLPLTVTYFQMLGISKFQPGFYYIALTFSLS